ncbi:hypothetical protein Ccrd_013578 [Cynara cardunculus var. scolymus]|uniref:Uncharacterized protein n=1 Tax=Cynara cardunculus var. scolymus TaxID=59895 RepID=A0A103YFB1_CYNCS|nr:hypothetical protein Ccrd_013578 [Cynara cardunculus var. scolymus]
MLHEEGDAAAQELQENIAAGEPFACHAQKCHNCKKGEHEKVEALQFAGDARDIGHSKKQAVESLIGKRKLRVQITNLKRGLFQSLRRQELGSSLHLLDHCLKENLKHLANLFRTICKVFSLYEIRPLENYLVDHLSFISEAMKRDKTLRKSEFLASFLEKKPR